VSKPIQTLVQKKTINNEAEDISLATNSTLRWQLKAKVSSMTPSMGGHTCWKFQGLSNHGWKDDVISDNFYVGHMP
jgi:hypothetical protein